MKSYLARMEALGGRGSDPEEDHYAADNILLEIARDNGYGDVADRFLEIDKWYS